MNALKFLRVEQHIAANGNATISSVVKSCAVNPRSARKYLDLMVANGLAIVATHHYRSNVTMRIYSYVGKESA